MFHVKQNMKKTIDTQRLILKNIEYRDKSNLFAFLCDKEVKKTYIVPEFNKEEEKDRYLSKLIEYCENPDFFIYGIYLNNELIGMINEVDKKDKNIEVGYVIDPKHKGNGYATETLIATTKELFTLGYEKVLAGFFEENKASKRVMEKAGMVKEDYEDDIEYNNTKHHCIYYSITNKQI